jgi:hypothetical protein
VNTTELFPTRICNIFLDWQTQTTVGIRSVLLVAYERQKASYSKKIAPLLEKVSPTTPENIIINKNLFSYKSINLVRVQLTQSHMTKSTNSPTKINRGQTVTQEVRVCNLYLSGLFQEKLNKTKRIFSEIYRCPCRDSNINTSE